MSGVTLKDLSDYHQGAMHYFKDGLVSEHNKLFAQTEEAGAVSFWPLGGTPLEGKVKFSFKETPPAEGDKGPENPSTISGVSSINVTRCGKNLLRYPYYWTTYTSAGLDFTVNSDGTVLINGTSSNSNAWFPVLDTPPWESVALSKLRLTRGNPYTASLRKISGSISGSSSINLQIQNQFIGNTGLNPNVSISQSVDFSSGSINWSSSRNSEKEIKARFGIWPNAVCNNIVVAPQLEYGDQATEFEPYIGDDYTIQLGDTYYGGEIDLATGLMTVTWKIEELDGTENWTLESSTPRSGGVYTFRCNNISRFARVNNPQLNGNAVCSHYETFVPSGTSYSGSYENVFIMWATAGAMILCYPSDNVADLKSWLASEKSAGHPVKVAFEMATPFTVQLTPLQLTALAQKDKYTPRMNTVYTDADSIQISYRKSLIHDEDEKVQAITALGGNV